MSSPNTSFPSKFRYPESKKSWDKQVGSCNKAGKKAKQCQKKSSK